ncbi:hypothetical protein COJ96_09775 [Bacillus sp. AFS073361]|nr:hypothetical protein COJ96_09775 [Bacillus sp. AFS073361]
MLYTDESLEKLRMEGDPVLDQIIAELFKNSQVGSVNNLLKQLMHNDQEYQSCWEFEKILSQKQWNSQSSWRK